MAAIEYLTRNQANDILKAIDDTRDKAIVTLFLGTGIFLNELTALNVKSVDWKKKVLSISSNRKRDIPLNDQVYDALARWSKERPDTRSAALFITTKGKVKDLSARGIDKLIRKYANQAGIKQKVNAQILRNSFAVSLFSEKISIEEASKVLGITDPDSIRRYIEASKMTPKEVPVETVAKVDTRSKIVQRIAKLIPIRPREAKVLPPVQGSLIPDTEQVLFGRDGVLEDIEMNISQKISVLLIGQTGLGKTHILKNICKANPDYIFVASAAPLKPMLTAICEKLIPDWKEKLPAKSRATAPEMVNLLTETFKGKQAPFLVIDMIDRLKATDVDPFLKLLEVFTVLSAADDMPPRLKQIWWKFKTIELKPLNKEYTKQLIKHLTQNLSISDYDLFETRILTLSNCFPLAIVDMVHQLGTKQVIMQDDIRELYHEAGMRYRDWTAAIVLIWGIMIMFRFVALGTHSFEGYILAGFGTAIMIVLRFFAFKMR